MFFTIRNLLKPKLSDFLLDLHRSLAHQGFAKILDIATGMPAVFVPPQAGLHQDPGTSLPQKSLNLGYRDLATKDQASHLFRLL